MASNLCLAFSPFSACLQVRPRPKKPRTSGSPNSTVSTPEMATIEEVAGYLKKPHNATCKAVVSQRNSDDRYIIDMTFEVANTEQLNVIIRNLKKLKCVSDVYRMNR